MKFEYTTIKTKNGKAGYLTLGTGPNMVLLVGYSGNLLHWNSELIYELAKSYTLYLPDNRNVGLTQSNNNPSMEGLASDTLDFIQALSLDKPILVGWSMGGIIAQALAYEHPEIIAGIGLIVSQPDYSYTRGGLHTLVTNLRENPGRENREKLTELFFSELPTIEFRKYMAKTILPIASYVYPYNESAQELQNIAVANWRSDRKKLANLNMPVLITCAKNDLVTDPAASIYLHQHIKNSKLISYPDGGHFFLHHYPKQLAKEIVQFFNP